MKEYQTIIIGGVKRNIISYDRMMYYESGNIVNGIEPLAEIQYLSLLFGNIGYTKTIDHIGLLDETPVELLDKTEVFDYIPTRNQLRITENMSLTHLLRVIMNWARGNTEKGKLIDKKKSFKLPNEEEIKYDITNHINIKKTCVLSEDISYWNTSNILVRRIHNMNPKIDEEYFQNHMSDFEINAGNMIVNYPHMWFVASIINPDILLSTIRNAEKEASMYADTIKRNGIEIPSLKNNLDVINRFKGIFKRKEVLTYKLYKIYGPNMFTLFNKQVDTNTLDVIPAVQFRLGEQKTITELIGEINKADLTGKIREIIIDHVDKNSLDFLDNYDEDIEILTLKRIYYTILQLNTYCPEVLDRQTKMVLSKPFFLDGGCFGLYSRFKNVFYLTSYNLEIHVCNPEEAIEYYKKTFGKTIYLDPGDIADTYMSPKCPECDFEIYMNNLVSQSNQVQNTVVQPTIQPTGSSIPVSTAKDVDEDPQFYGFSYDSVVES